MALPVFPSLPGIMFPVKRIPTWDTVKQDALSGKRVRSQNYSNPVWHWEVGFDFLRSASAYQEFQQLADFVNAAMGGTGLFLYNEPTDNTATAQQFAIADGSSANYQLVRSLYPGGLASPEPVFFPNVITDVKVNSVGTGAYTVSPYGQVVFNTPPNAGNVLTWDGTFYWGCRFDDDQFEFSNFMLNLFDLRSLKFSSEKLP
jgi:uncharacterized protein (TIGR02217 family)